MKHIVFLSGILLLCTFSQCKQESLHSFVCAKCEEIPLDPLNAIRTVPGESFFSKVTYIPIETRDSFLIGKVDQFIAFDRKFILLDRSRSHSVFIVDSLGKFMALIHKVGAGPGEYADPKNISIDPFNGVVNVLCDRTHKVISYDFEGNFKREKRISIYSSQVAATAKDRYIFYTNFKPNNSAYRVGTSFPNLALTNQQGKLLESADYYSTSINTRYLWGAGKTFSRPYPDTISINPDHSNIVYYITSKAIFPRYIFDFGTYSINKEYFKDALNGDKSVRDKFNDLSDKYCTISKYLEGPEHIYLSYTYKNQHHNVFISKKTKKTLQFRNLHHVKIPLSNPVYMSGNKLYYLIEPNTLKTRKDKMSRVSNLLKITQMISETDNPVIVEVVLPDF